MQRITTATRAINLFGAGKDGYRDGDLANGIAPTDLNAAAMNGPQEEILAVGEAAGIAPDGGDLSQLLKAIIKIVGGSSRVRGLVGANNAGTPNTQFDFSAAAVTFRNPVSGITPSAINVGPITNNILTAGPVANGRDQAGAFAASSWVHFYFIYNITTGAVATVSSSNAPSAGPALPGGYTSWAYIGAVYLSAGSALAAGYFRGSWFTYQSTAVVVNSGTSLLRTAVSLATSVPPNALMIRPRVATVQVTSNGSGTYLMNVTLEVVTAVSAYVHGIGGTAGANLNMFGWGGATQLPNVGQNINYFITMSSGSTPITNITIDGYSVPNGGE